MTRVDALVVLHSVRTWLERTKTWIHSQVRALPPEIEAHLVCDATENLAQFPYPEARLHVLAQRPPLERRLEHWARRSRLAEFRYATRIAVKLSASVMHSHFGPEAWRERGVARAAGMRQVVTFYGYDVTRVPASSATWRQRYVELFEAASLVLCEGPHMRRELIALGADPARTRVQHLGIDLARSPFVLREWSSSRPLRVLLAATFNEKKGLSYALQGIAEALRRRSGLDVRVSIVGDASAESESQRERERLHQLAAELGSERVNFMGFRPHAELFELAAQHDVFMSPSVRAADGDTEGGAPVTLIELAATGLPVVSTTHCDIPNVLRGPAARLLAAERDHEGLAERLLWLVDHPREWAAITSHVRTELEERFDAARQGHALASLYREVAAAPRPQASLLVRGALVARGFLGAQSTA